MELDALSSLPTNTVFLLPVARSQRPSTIIAPAPSASTVSTSLASFLDEKLCDDRSLSQTSSLVSELESDCSNLDRCLRELHFRRESSITEYAGLPDGVHRVAGRVGARLVELGSLTAAYDPRSDGGVGGRKILGDELPALAKEVVRVETARAYAEAASKLDGLIGDVEVAVSSALRKSTRKSAQNLKEVRQHTIHKLKEIEDSVTQVARVRPNGHIFCLQWIIESIEPFFYQAPGNCRSQSISFFTGMAIPSLVFDFLRCRCRQLSCCYKSFNNARRTEAPVL